MTHSDPHYEVVPGVGVAGVSFGEPRSSLRERLGEYQAHQRFVEEGVVDWHFDMTMTLTYDADDRLAVIELSDADVVWNGIALLERPLCDVLDDLAEAGMEARFHETGSFVVDGLGMSINTEARANSTTRRRR